MDARRISFFAIAPLAALIFASIATRRDYADIHDAAITASPPRQESPGAESPPEEAAVSPEPDEELASPEPPPVDPMLLEAVEPPFPPHWGGERVIDLEGLRGEICLNGLWRVSTAGLPVAEALPAHWGWGLVPSFDGWLLAPGLEGRSEGTAVLARPLRLPLDWAGRRVSVRVTGLSAEARLMLDGEAVGAIMPPEGEVDITASVRAGEEHQLSLATGGVILGEVAARSMPAGPRMASVVAWPSFERESVTLDITLAGLRDIAVVTFSVGDERQFEKTVTVAPDGRVRLTVPWKTPTAWTPEKPVIQRVLLRVSGAGIEDVFPVEFAFSDRAWREGRFLLNGKPTRIRAARTPLAAESNGSVELIDGIIAGVRAAGFNALAFEDIELAKAFAERADRKGLLILTRADEAALARHPSLVLSDAAPVKPMDSASAVETYLVRRLTGNAIAELAAPPETGWRLENEPAAPRDFSPGMRGSFMPMVPPFLSSYLSSEGGWRMGDIGESIVAANEPFIAGLLEETRTGELVAGDRARWRLLIVNDSAEAVEYYYTWRAVMDDTRLAAGAGGRRLPPSASAEAGLLVPLRSPGVCRVEVDITSPSGVQRISREVSVLPAEAVEEPE